MAYIEDSGICVKKTLQNVPKYDTAKIWKFGYNEFSHL
jgi:hypothetical protein